MYKIDEIKMLRLGQRDENLARSLPFDCSDWLELYPGASIAILFRRPGESTITPMITTLEGTTLTWLIHDFEVGKTGVGNAEFRAVDTAGLRRKSRIIPCSIEETLLGDDETVLYTQDQVDDTLAHISEAAQSAQAAKASEEAAALSAQEAAESATSASAAASVAASARDAAQAAKIAAETAQHQAESAQSGVHTDAEAAEQAKVAAQAAQASAQGAASQASADRAAAESARASAEAAAEHAEAVVEGIDQAGADQVAAVNAEGQAQVTAVDQAGTTQVGNVNAAGTTQVNAVQAKGTQVINSIPADYSTLSGDVTDLKSALNITNGIVGYFKKSYTTNSSHSANNDRLDVSINNGQKYELEIKSVGDANLIAQVFAINSAGESTSIGNIRANSGTHEYTAAFDIKAFGLYNVAPSVETTVTLIINREDSIPNELDAINSNYIPGLKERIDVVSNFASNGVQTFYSYGDFSVGGLYPNGDLLPTQKTRVSSTTIITIDRDITVRTASGFRWGYIPFTDGTAGSWTGWKMQDTTIEAGTSFKVQISKDPEGSADASVIEYISALTFLSDLGKSANVEGGTVKYSGEKIPSKRGSFDYKKLFTMSFEQGITSQDIEVYNDYLFVAFSGTEQIRVYNLADKSLDGAISVAVNHGSQLQFSNEFYSSDDVYPLLYVGGYTDNIINVLRITKTESTWTATIVRKLYIPTTNGYYFAPTLDIYNNILYCFGNKLASTIADGNNNVIVRCNLNQLTDNGNDTFTPEIIDSKTIPFIGVFQGGKYYNGRLYISFADPGTPHNPKIVSIDPSSGYIMTSIDMTPVTTSEAEGLCYRIVGNNILWIFTDYWNVFQLQFYN